MKIAFDTNMIVRMVTHDDEAHLKKIVGIIGEHDTKDIFICYGILIEAYFVLTKLYDFTKEKTLNAFEDLLRIEQFAFEHETAIRLAIVKSRKGFEFHDSLIGEIGSTKNIKTKTFDKGLKGNNSFDVL
jgi:predicted nucleic-acid-binding protein